MKTRRVVVLPGTMLCGSCGYALRADGNYRHGQTHHVVWCSTSACDAFEVRMRFPLTFIDCEVKASEENPHGPQTDPPQAPQAQESGLVQ